MAIFYSRSENDKKMRYLYQENKKLKAKISDLMSENEQLKKYVGEQLSQIKNYEEMLSAKEVAIISFESTISKMQQEHQALSDELAQAETATSVLLPQHLPPPKGPGRKTKASPEDIALIRQMRNEGYSYGQIAVFLSERTAKRWSKSSVYDTVKRLGLEAKGD